MALEWRDITFGDSRPTPRRAESHRGGAGCAGRQDRVEPADERDATRDQMVPLPATMRDCWIFAM